MALIPTVVDAAADFAKCSANVYHDASGGVPLFRVLQIASGDARFGGRHFSRLITSHQSGATSWFADREAFGAVRRVSSPRLRTACIGLLVKRRSALSVSLATIHKVL